jgi:hypothetical protein
LRNLIGPQLLTKFLTFCGTQRFINVFPILSQINQVMPSHPYVRVGHNLVGEPHILVWLSVAAFTLAVSNVATVFDLMQTGMDVACGTI